MFRSITEADLDRVLACTVDEPVGWVDARLYRERCASGLYRPGLTWIAVDGGQILARAIWGLSPGAAQPRALDCLYTHGSVPDRAGLAAGLLGAAHAAFRSQGTYRLPWYDIPLPTGWRDRPDVLAALSWRREAARRVGLNSELERLRYEWTPGSGPLRPPTARLVIRPEPDDAVFLDAFRRVAEGSLDWSTNEGLALLGADRQAREAMRHYLRMPGPRDWWRLAYTPHGSLAGLAIPSRDPGGPVIAYVGVVPELRGHGYIDDLLAEGTSLLAAAGAGRIRADTDFVNRPMAAAFDRAGYRNVAVRLVLSQPSPAANR